MRYKLWATWLGPIKLIIQSTTGLKENAKITKGPRYTTMKSYLNFKVNVPSWIQAISFPQVLRWADEETAGAPERCGVHQRPRATRSSTPSGPECAGLPRKRSRVTRRPKKEQSEQNGVGSKSAIEGPHGAEESGGRWPAAMGGKPPSLQEVQNMIASRKGKQQNRSERHPIFSAQ